MAQEQIKRWMMAIAISGAVFAVFSLYLFLRRGYYDLYIINKAFSSASFVVIGIVLLIGPFCRLYQRFDHWILYRKELGLVGFAAALAHTVISLFFLPDKFAFASFFTYTSFNRGLVPFLFGAGSIILFSILTVISLEAIKCRIENDAWWRWQYWGVRIAFVLLFLHLVVMKYPGWISWYVQGGGKELARPFMPPGSIAAGSFGLFVLLVRLAELVDGKVAKITIPLLFLFLVLFWIESYFWGISAV